MKLQKGPTNNAIVVQLENVRPHPNADRLKLSTVLGAQVVVGLDAKDGDVMIYFDSNLCLSPEYLKANNLYSNPEMNQDTSKKGYFGSHGRVKAQKFRGEVSNGYVAPLGSILNIEAVRNGLNWNRDMVSDDIFHIGDEFTHVGGVKICEKYIPPQSNSGQYSKAANKRTKKNALDSEIFWKHWDTKQLMREKHRITPGMIFVEEKIHGTSGRTGHVLCYRPWWKFWAPKEEWKVVSGTRRTDRINAHMSQERKEIHVKLAKHLRKGEQLYYEIYGYDHSGKGVQKGFPYGCFSGEYRVMLYRVTITTPDGYCIDLPRPAVYRRAQELGLEQPPVLFSGYFHPGNKQQSWPFLMSLAEGNSSLDPNTLREGIVVWFMNADGQWDCLKHKSPEFLIRESQDRDEGAGDVEDVL